MKLQLGITTLAVGVGLFGFACEQAPTVPDSFTLDAPSVKANAGPKRVVHHASVGGADVCEALGLPTGCEANFSLVANQKADGSVSGQWQDTFAGGVEGIHVAVDCLNVVDNVAFVSGVITHGTDSGGEDVSGQPALTAVADNGTSANDSADQITFSFIGTPFDCNNLPPGDPPLFDLTHGQVKVW